MTALLRYDAACQAIAAAKTVDEVKDWIDKAAAVREYTRRIRNRQLEIDAIEIRVRAKRRRGEILADMRERGVLAEGRPKTVDDERQFPERLTLEDLDISRDESSEEQKMAAIAGDAFERLVARCREYAEANPDKHSFDVLREQKTGGGPINGARAMMGSRQEPDDSLDYFPTPPFATRALVELVLPQFGINEIESAWEPACGEGHIAEVLREYCQDVHATDIFDYGYQDGLLDFLSIPEPQPGEVGSARDWIITNPPFEEKALEFTLQALRWARVGVAMFVPLRWLETIGRYEKLFKPTPPTLVCPFVERVALCKGEWNPTGGTATAYMWLVWRHVEGDGWRGHSSMFWIPPVCKETLTRPDDAARFTTQPVTRREPPTDSSGNTLNADSITGEIVEPSEAAE